MSVSEIVTDVATSDMRMSGNAYDDQLNVLRVSEFGIGGESKDLIISNSETDGKRKIF